MGRFKILIVGLILIWTSVLSVGVMAIFEFPLVDQTEMEQSSAETAPTSTPNTTPQPNRTPNETPTPAPTPAPTPTPTPEAEPTPATDATLTPTPDWPTREEPCKPLPDEWKPNRHSSDLKSDSDKDGLSDFCEDMVTGTDYATRDSDGDGLSDFREYHNTTTSPTNGDMDNDGISDGIELTGTYKGEEIEGLDPHSADLVLMMYPSDTGSPDDIDSDVYDDIESEWADLDIQNPDGSTGVDVHVVKKDEHDGINWSQPTDVQFNDPNKGEKGIVTASVEQIDEPGVAGESSGIGLRIEPGGDTKVKLQHETLHVIVGELPEDLQHEGDTIHMSEGYLAHEVGDTDPHFPDELVEHMNASIYSE